LTTRNVEKHTKLLLSFLTTGSQEKGLVFVEGIGQTGMIEMMTAVSMDVGTKMDRLTIGILPIKMEALYLFNSPTWMRVLMALMSPFIGKKTTGKIIRKDKSYTAKQSKLMCTFFKSGKKMRKRIKTLPKKADPQAFFEENIGKEFIPTGISLLTGAVEKDMVAETLERLTS
jgi:CRAL/TRIO domain